MIKSYFKTAWRHIIKRPFYSIVNIAGLFAGITFVVLIGAYVWSEMRVNKDLQNSNTFCKVSGGVMQPTRVLPHWPRWLKD
jgi:hypothetical protein